ncbi:MAG: hypothetical protein DMG06_10380 [Acidobacteria bacterium]|nr:MAG: hypothetical protein DMG06_10380 [Acidobacteriota bacterium]
MTPGMVSRVSRQKLTKPWADALDIPTATPDREPEAPARVMAIDSRLRFGLAELRKTRTKFSL